MTDEPTGWERAYQKGHLRGREPHEEAASLAERFRADGVRRILDLGCGDGRHLVWLAAQGFEMTGLDSAPTALRLAEEFLSKEGLPAELACTDMTTLPWLDEAFGAVISVKVINHQDIADIRKTLAEIARVLRPGGWVFVVVATYEPGEIEKSTEVDRLGPKLFTKKAGHEAGVPHYFASEDEWVAEFAAFDIVDVHRDKQGKSVILARKS